MFFDTAFLPETASFRHTELLAEAEQHRLATAARDARRTTPPARDGGTDREPPEPGPPLVRWRESAGHRR